MKAIDFVVRNGMGAVQRGEIQEGGSVTRIDAGLDKEISLNVRQMDLQGYVREGSNLHITLADGRTIVLDNYFGTDGAPTARLFISADGYLNEVNLVEGTDDVFYAQYGPTEMWGKWSPSDDLIFLSGNEGEVIAPEGNDVSMLGAGLLAAPGLWGGAAAAAAAGVGAAVIGGGSDGTDTPARIEPTVDQQGELPAIGGDGVEDPSIEITGTAEPGSEVIVTIGEEEVTTASGSDGTWGVVFEDDTFPDDGTYDVGVVVIEPDGTETDLGGPVVVIDMTPPDLEFTIGTNSTGEVINAEEHQAGTVIGGNGEAGSSLDVTVENVTHTVTVGEDGTWSVTFGADEIATGEYVVDVSVVATDSLGNSATYTDTLTVDTVADPVIINTDGFEGDGTLNLAEMDDGIQVTGTSPPGVTVTVALGGAEQQVVTGDDGTWEATFEAATLPEGEYDATVTATTTDAAGNSTTTTGTVHVDTATSVAFDGTPIAGDDVVNQSEAAGSVSVSGTAQPGATVAVSFGGTSFPAQVAPDGNWTLSIPAGTFVAGEYDVDMTVTATDLAGNTASATRTVTIDTETAVSIDGGLAGGDDLLNAVEAPNGVTLSGAAQPGASVVVTLGAVSHTVVAGDGGTWSSTFTAAEVPEGAYVATVTATATDPAGNTATDTSSLTVDTTGFVAFADAPVEGDDVINHVEASDGVVLSGTTEPGSSVTIMLGTVTRTATVDGAGNWTVQFAATDIPAGEHTTTITATAVDASGNVSSATNTIEIDTLVRDFQVTSTPGGSDGVLNAEEAAQGLVLTGVTEEGSSVVVQLGAHSVHATVAANGTWEAHFTAAQLGSGEYTTTMTATATDAAGNVATTSDMVRVDTDAGSLALSTVPIEADDVINFVEASDGVTINGTSDAGNVVQVSLGGVTHSVVTASNGTWSSVFANTEIPQGTYDASITASTTDAAGNSRTVTDTVHIDTAVDNLTISLAPIAGEGVINEAEAAAGFDVEGTVEAGSTVNVTIGTVTRPATVDANGNWTAHFLSGDISAGEYTADITVNVTDMAGNTATATDTVEVDTLVNALSSTQDVTSGDGSVNAAEARGGFSLGGQVEAGSTVEIAFEGKTYHAQVAASGVWTLAIPATDIPAGTYDSAFTIRATDAAGNTSELVENIHIDTELPGAADVASYTRDHTGLRAISIESTDDSVSIAHIDDAGNISDVSATAYDIPALGETTYAFDTTVPDGSHLVLTTEDDAGNATGTFLAVDDPSTSIVDLGSGNLGNYQIETIDLQFAEDSQVTLSETQLLALSSNSDAVLIKGGADDTVSISGAVNTGQTQDVDGASHTVYTLGDTGVLIIDDDITVVI